MELGRAQVWNPCFHRQRTAPFMNGPGQGGSRAISDPQPVSLPPKGQPRFRHLQMVATFFFKEYCFMTCEKDTFHDV